MSWQNNLMCNGGLIPELFIKFLIETQWVVSFVLENTETQIPWMYNRLDDITDKTNSLYVQYIVQLSICDRWWKLLHFN